MKTKQVRELATNRIKAGYPAIEELDFASRLRKEDKDGDLLRLIGHNEEFLGLGYLGKENRSVGWMLTDQEETIDQYFFQKLFMDAKAKRGSLYADEGTNAFRVFNGAGDGLGGLTIDYYNDYYVVSLYNQGIYRFLDAIQQALFDVFKEAKGIYEKKNVAGKPTQSRLIHGEEAPEPHLVRENGIRYATYLNDGWMTGIFLDQRHVRAAMMNQYAVGKRLLNLFSYTGAFSVAGAMGGATQTVNIDLANRSKELTAEQFEVNGLNPDDHEIRVIDTASYLDYAKKHALEFGVIVIDPPTFARSKAGTWRIEEDYPQVIADSLAVLETGGTLIASTNAWMLSADEFYNLILAGFKQAGVDGEVIETYGLPEDFPTNRQYIESQYLKVFVLRKLN